MNTTLILWLWPVFVFGTLIAFGLYLKRQDDAARDDHHPTAAE
ncbi:hypothetical protein [Devosia sp. Root685]|nr:hypothetical protein [Devosia sp. Root685]